MYRLAKRIMKIFEVFPVSPGKEVGESSEVFRHRSFTDGTDAQRRRIMYESSLAKYRKEMREPWDVYFNIDISRFLKGRNVLDLGCFTGGRTVAWSEKYKTKRLSGIDLSPVYIDAARQFARYKKVDADFLLGVAEKLPYHDGTFDAILSYDVLEHVQDVRRVLSECHRVLCMVGVLIAVFPGYFHPLEHHLDFVTKAPGIHYFFSGDSLLRAYHEICLERGEEAYWYRRVSNCLEPWEKGNTLNGITLRQFRKMIAGGGWSVVFRNRQPVGSHMNNASRTSCIRLISLLGRACVHIPVLEELFLNRVVFIIEKKANGERKAVSPDDSVFHEARVG